MRKLRPVILAFVGWSGSVGYAANPRIPVIYDTDIGADIDDTWALGFILASPELDLKLVVSDSHNALSKASIIAKFLERAGRAHIPVGIGIQCDDREDAQDPWPRDYDLSRYPGKVHRDGVQAIIDVIMNHPEPPITLLADRIAQYRP